MKKNTYTGTWDTNNWYQVLKNGKKFSHTKSLKFVNHSPDGFAWGYNGSGPTQLAFAILLEEAGEYFAKQNYMKFRDEVVSSWLQSGFCYTSEDFDFWAVRLSITKK